MPKKPTYFDVIAQLPTSLRKNELGLGVTFCTGTESSNQSINSHNEQQFHLSLPPFFRTMSSLVRRSIAYYLVIEHHPYKAAYQAHCHGITSDLSLNEISLAKYLWIWHFYNDKFVDAAEVLTSAELIKHKVKIDAPHLFARKESGIQETISYSLKGCNTLKQVSSITDTSNCDIRDNQQWYKQAKSQFHLHTSKHWLDILERNARKGVKLDDFAIWATCYLARCKEEQNILMNSS